MEEPIAIVGIGCRFPQSENVNEFWKVLEEGIDTTTDVPKDRFSLKQYGSNNKSKGKATSKRGAFIKNNRDFDAPFFGLSPKEASQTDPQIRMLLESTWNAIEDAGIIINENNRDCGVYIGHMTQDYNDMQCRSNRTLTSHAMQGNAVCMAANRVSFFLNVHGPSIVIDTACSSGLVALSYAVDDLRSGRCSWCLAGGCNALLDPRYFVGFTDWGITSPDGKCFSFDVRGNGYVRGEGAAMIAIKKLSDAKKNGDHIYCLIEHLGVNHDGVKRAITSPNETAQLELMERVYSESKIDPTSIDYCEAHGTGTAVGDVIETGALKSALCGSKRTRPLIIGSVKTNCGHLEGAAGSIGVIKTALALQHKKIPKNLNFETPNPKIKFDEWKLRVPVRLENWPKHDGPRRACVNSFGIGGTNAHVIMEGYDGEPEIREIKGKLDNNRYSIFFNAKKGTLFGKMAKNLLSVWNENLSNPKSLNDICYTLAKRRHQLSNRMCITGTADDVSVILKELSEKENSKRVFKGFAIENTDRPLAFVFCGQGAQWKDMGVDLYNRDPIYRKSLDECCKYCDEVSGWSLLEKIKSEDVNGTRVSQPATTAVQIALVDFLEYYGVRPNAVVGHSSGEIAAAYAAGAVNRKDAMLLAYYRGSCITDYAPRDGGMAAVSMSAEEAEELIKNYKNIIVACYNSPGSLTLSGDLESLKQLGDDLQKDNKFFRLLKVTHGFHSSHMLPAMPYYRKAIENIKTSQKLTAKFYSSLREQLIEDGSLLTCDYFVENLTHPVGFCKAIQTMVSDIPDIAILEIGPHPALKGPLLQTIPDEEASMRTCATLTRQKDASQCLYEAFGTLHCNGVNIHKAFDAIVPNGNFYYNLPLYPYDRQYLWCEAQESVRFRELDPVNTLLGRRNLTESPSWDVELDVKQLPYMKDHNVGGSILAPGAMFLEMCIAAARDAWKTDEVTLYNCKFLQALIFPQDDYMSLRTTLNSVTGEIVISRVIIDSDHQDGEYIHHFKCFAKKQADTWFQTDIMDEIPEAELDCKVEADPKKIYEGLSNNGLMFGPTFQTMKRLRKGVKRGLVDVELSAEPQLYEDYNMHPTLIDSIFQSMISTVIGGSGAYLPTNIQTICYQKASQLPGKYTVYVKQTRCDKKLVGDVWLYSSGNPFLWAKNVELTRVETQAIDKRTLLSRCLNEIKYEEMNIINPNAEELDSSIKIGLLSKNYKNSELSLELVSKCKNVVICDNPENIPSDVSALIYIGEDKTLPKDQPMKINDLLDFTHTIIREETVTPFYVITIGATAIPTNVSFSGAIGFCRTVQTEQPNIDCKLVDLDGKQSVSYNLSCLIDILNRDICSEHSCEVIIRDGYVYGPRILPKEKIIDDCKHESDLWYLDIEKPGLLDTFVRRDFYKRNLKDHEILIEVEVCGLSYKDVMIAMGLLKEEAFKGGLTGLGIGCECAGRVVEIGPNCVGNLKVGDRVLSSLTNGISTYTVTHDNYIFPIPDCMTMDQAAGIYVPFSTAYASLVYHGKIKKEDVVLIHAGSGGVGSCAIQIAVRKGCTVIATASTPEKKQYCLKLGAKYVFDSRSFSFVQDIKKLTNGKGVDVILNSLSDKMMYESIRLLAPYGRFVEIGKIDAVNDRSLNIHDFLENCSYCLFDLDRYVAAHHELGHEWGLEMMKMIQNGEFVPPKVTIFPSNEIEESFRHMAKAKHIGKICIRIRNENREVLPCKIPYKPIGITQGDRTAVIIGARGLGLSVFQWLSERHISHFVLLSKSGKLGDENMLVVDSLIEKGITVKIVAADVSNKDELFSVLDKTLVDMPQLAGVIHSAMFLQDMTIMRMNNEKFHLCYDPKAFGIYNMHLYEKKLNKPYEFFICFSSISSVIGNRGQCNYCSGNFYMESLVALRRSQGLVGNVLNLGAVGDVGAVARDTKIVNKSLKDSMVSSLQVLAGLQHIFDNMKTNRQLIIDFMSEGILGQVQGNQKFRAYEAVKSQTKERTRSKSAGGTELSQALTLEGEERKKFVEQSVKTSVANVLGLDVAIIRPENALSAIGIDSIVSVELSNWIKEQYDTQLSVFDLTSGKTVAGLIENMMDSVLDHSEEGNKKKEIVVKGETDISKLYTLEELIEREPAKYISQIPKTQKETVATQSKEEKPKEKEENDALYDITQSREYIDANKFLDFLTINPYFMTQRRLSSTVSNVEETYMNCVNYTCYDYLGLNFDEEIHEGVNKLIKEYGTSASASRLAGGQIPIHKELEKELSEFIGVSDCIVYLGGHTTNVNAIKALCNQHDLIIVDELSHNSILEGAIYSQATRMTFAHNDPKDLEKKLSKNRSKYEKVLIAVEGVYSMDGDICDLPNFIKIKRKYNCILMVDEAHSIGTVGKTGRGVGEYYGIDPNTVDMWMGSLGKAFVSAGGYIAGSKELVTLLRWKSPGYVYSIGMPPPQCATCLYSMKKIKAEPWRVDKLRENIKYFQDECEKNGIDIGKSKGSIAPVVPVMIYDTNKCLKVIHDLLGLGVYVGPGIYPACELDRARLRFFISAAHTKEQIDKTVNALRQLLF